mmetsp:Transcript_30853/g.67366  ORF Transcript_30853/g.67366 Transcript_30853/m.67366 type:complete len:200 (+) Transcript_30853:1969-2568(+)
MKNPSRSHASAVEPPSVLSAKWQSHRSNGSSPSGPNVSATCPPAMADLKNNVLKIMNNASGALAVSTVRPPGVTMTWVVGMVLTEGVFQLGSRAKSRELHSLKISCPQSAAARNVPEFKPNDVCTPPLLAEPLLNPSLGDAHAYEHGSSTLRRGVNTRSNHHAGQDTVSEGSTLTLAVHCVEKSGSQVKWCSTDASRTR